MSSPRGTYLFQIAALAGLYVGLAEIGLSVGALPGNVTPVWPPTGLALAALVLFGRGLWPGVALGALLVNGLSDVPLAAACGMAIGNTIEAVLGATLLALIPGFRPSLDRVVDVVALAVLAAGVSTALGASVGVASLTLGGVVASGDYWTTWQVYWAGDALGALVVAPMLMAWARPGSQRIATRARLIGLAVVVALTGVTLVAFSGPVEREYLVFPLLICAALLMRQRGATVAVAVASGTAVVLTVQGVGPFVTGLTIHNLRALDTFLAVAAVTTLALAAVVSERDRADLEARRLAGQLRSLADTDSLTGLGNRRSFDAELERHRAEVARYGPTGALLVLDLDHLKEVNDTLGHRAGDDLIVSVADLLRRRLRGVDSVSRLGGDEFAIILTRATHDEAQHVADALVEAVRSQVSVSVDDQELKITASVGVAVFDSPRVSARDMLVRADLAMYEAKQAGRDRAATHPLRADHTAERPAGRGR